MSNIKLLSPPSLKVLIKKYKTNDKLEQYYIENSKHPLYPNLSKNPSNIKQDNNYFDKHKNELLHNNFKFTPRFLNSSVKYGIRFSSSMNNDSKLNQSKDTNINTDDHLSKSSGTIKEDIQTKKIVSLTNLLIKDSMEDSNILKEHDNEHLEDTVQQNEKDNDRQNEQTIFTEILTDIQDRISDIVKMNYEIDLDLSDQKNISTQGKRKTVKFDKKKNMKFGKIRKLKYSKTEPFQEKSTEPIKNVFIENVETTLKSEMGNLNLEHIFEKKVQAHEPNHQNLTFNESASKFKASHVNLVESNFHSQINDDIDNNMKPILNTQKVNFDASQYLNRMANRLKELDNKLRKYKQIVRSCKKLKSKLQDERKTVSEPVTMTDQTLKLSNEQDRGAKARIYKEAISPYDEFYYELRQRKMNLLHYKKSDRTIRLNMNPVLEWKQPISTEVSPCASKRNKTSMFIKTPSRTRAAVLIK